MTNYTPTTEEIRRHWGIAVPHDRRDARLADFDRWLAGHEAEVKAEALEDAARAFDGGTISLDVFSNEVEKSYWRVANEQRSILVDSLRARAAEYRKEQGNE